MQSGRLYRIVDTLFTDNYPLATSVIGKTALGYQDLSAQLSHDPARARDLLDEAGWVPGADGIRVKDGQRLSLVVNEAAPQPRSFASVVSGLLSRVRRAGYCNQPITAVAQIVATWMPGRSR